MLEEELLVSSVVNPSKSRICF